ncbi:hypothetical protein [Acrocarpospora sp. B8E8]|uniref:hypothetical protein n=1 Tax=Acrocarpospora sp. B8E8 TaxID=3153572 RepID=UPI00325F0C1A
MTEFVTGDRADGLVRVEVVTHAWTGVPKLTEVANMLLTLDRTSDTVGMALLVKRAGVSGWRDRRDHRRVAERQLEEQIKQRELGIRVDRLYLNSPLTVELIASGTLGAGVLTAFVYLFKNPDKLGEWWPKLQTSWYNGRAEAVKAKKAYEMLRQAQTEIDVYADPPQVYADPPHMPQQEI